jgi:hypothetical protein
MTVAVPDEVHELSQRVARLSDEIARVVMRDLAGLGSPTGRADSDHAGEGFIDDERSALRAVTDALEADRDAVVAAVDLLTSTDLAEAQSLSGTSPYESWWW